MHRRVCRGLTLQDDATTGMHHAAKQQEIVRPMRSSLHSGAFLYATTVQPENNASILSRNAGCTTRERKYVPSFELSEWWTGMKKCDFTLIPFSLNINFSIYFAKHSFKVLGLTLQQPHNCPGQKATNCPGHKTRATNSSSLPSMGALREFHVDRGARPMR